MQKKIAAVFCGFLLTGLVALAQNSSQDQLNDLKNLPQDQQNSVMQGIFDGKRDGTSKKTDPLLETPETIRPDYDALEAKKKEARNKTIDGHRLRIEDEDPELRADDSILIDLKPIDREAEVKEIERRKQNNPQNGQVAPPTLGASGGLDGLPNAADARNGAYRDKQEEEDLREGYGRDPVHSVEDFKPMTDEQKSRLNDFRQRILQGNPYKLNRFGVLEIPGLPSIPMAGLTASEATRRLSADPDLRDFRIKVTLLRLQPFGEDALKAYGYDLFEGVPSTFAPVSDIQVPIDYVVGPGDTLDIQLYGNEPSSYSLTVGRDGRIKFPKLGPIMVSGLSFENARETIEERVAQQLIGTHVSVTMGKLRSIRVFVLGEANKPGSYTVSGLSTMTNALFVSGGVKKIGSLRNIELKRNGKLVTTLDLYDLLLHGDTSGDRQLMPGDVIFIPPIGRTVSVDGAVRRPAIYELKGEKTVAQVIEIAGGLAPDADSKTVQLERILPSTLYEMQNIDLTVASNRAFEVDNGDKLRVPLIRPTLENSVTLTGYVYRPGQFQYIPGERLSDIIRSFDELRPNADRRYIMIRREIPPEQKVEVISANLERALAARGSADDPKLQPRDKIYVFDLSASRERILAPVLHDLELQAGPDHPAEVVSVSGQVKAPGKYPLEPAMRISDLIRAGGSLDDEAFGGEAELTRYQVVNGSGRQTDLIPINLAAIRQGDQSANIQLMPYDILVIKPVPQWDEPGTIEVSGEVRFPGKYPIHRGETLSSVVRRAGGFTDLAFAAGTIFTREELKKREKEEIDVLTERLRSDLAALTLESVATSAALANGSNAAAQSVTSLAIGQQLLNEIKDAKPVGRLVIDINRVMKGKSGSADDVALRDGDRLLVPKQVQTITVLGEVQSPTSHVFRAGLTRDDYIAKSGGTTYKADRRRIYVIRANGDVVSGERDGWFRRSQVIELQAGDTIVVPLDTERIRSLPLYQAVTTIIYNLAVAVLAIRSV
jgi:protein involved in polysaccharide export with SLBB domain